MLDKTTPRSARGAIGRPKVNVSQANSYGSQGVSQLQNRRSPNESIAAGADSYIDATITEVGLNTIKEVSRPIMTRDHLQVINDSLNSEHFSESNIYVVPDQSVEVHPPAIMIGDGLVGEWDSSMEAD